MGEAGLSLLVSVLRQGGIHVGVGEELRLRQVLGPGLAEGADLYPLVRAVVVKSSEALPAFDAAFSGWLAQLGPGRPASAPAAALSPRRGQRLWRAARRGLIGLRRRALLGAAVLVLVLGAVWLGRHLPRRTPAPPPAQVLAPSPAPDGGVVPQGRPIALYRVPVPHMSWTRQPARRSYRGGVVAAIGLCTGLALWLLLRRRSDLPQVAPLDLGDGTAPSRPPLRLPGEGPVPLLGRRDEAQMVHGAGGFVAGEPLRRLDLRATVYATARAGGLPTPRYQRARHQREIWLWLDSSTGSLGAGGGEAARLCEEVAGVLDRAGLPVERASYWGVPERIERQGGGWFAPAEVDDRRDSALVVLVTDGRLLGRALASAATGPATQGLLRQLAAWPHLALVDSAQRSGAPSTGAGQGGLSAMLAPYGLTVLSPPELAAHLGGLSRRSVSAEAVLSGDGRLWLAACLLSPQPLDQDTALLLARALDLRVGGWDLPRLPWSGGRLDVAHAERAALLGWLRRAAPDLMERAAAWLWRRQDEVRAGLAGGEALAAQVDGRLLQLWLAPVEAAVELYRLWGGGLAAPIEAELGKMGPLEVEGMAQVVVLPFWLRDCPALVQVMLREMGLARAARWRPAVRAVRRPGRVYLGLGLCGGLLAAGLVQQALSLRAAPGEQAAGPPRIEQVNEPAYPMIKVEPGAGGRYVVSARGMKLGEVPAGAVARIAWTAEERPDCPLLTDSDRDGMEFVRVCAGAFMMGSDERDSQAYSNERPVHRVELGEFWIGKYEVTRKQYGWQGAADEPANYVSWDEARKFCQDHGHRLPTEEEWEYAARGREARIYPWGDTFDSARVVDELSAVTSKPEGAGPFGALHQAGNVWEWVEDCYQSDAYSQRRKTPAATGAGVDKLPIDKCPARVLRGGSFFNEPRFLRSAVRDGLLPEYRYEFFGFRCVRGGAPSSLKR